MLTRLDRRRASYAEVVSLFARSVEGGVKLYISTVNLAEVLQRARPVRDEVGFDPVTLLAGFAVEAHRPDVEVARRAAALATLPDASLADRFAVATAEVLGGRLHTTDTVLARALRRTRLPVTLY